MRCLPATVCGAYRLPHLYRTLAGCLEYAPAGLVQGLAATVQALRSGSGDPRALALTALSRAHSVLTEKDFGDLGAPHFSLCYAWRVGLPAAVVLLEAARVLRGDRRSRQTSDDMPQGFVVALLSAHAEAIALVAAGKGHLFIELVYVGQELRGAMKARWCA